MHTPDACFRYTAELKVNPRRSADYAQKVVEAVGLQEGGTGHGHLSATERELLRALVRRKA